MDRLSEENMVIVNVDKVVVKITGIQVQGLNITQLEETLQKKLKTMTRIIGVTGKSMEMDVYGLGESDIKRNKKGLIQAISLAEGIKVTELMKIASIKKIREIDIDNIPPYVEGGCAGERWMLTDE